MIQLFAMASIGGLVPMPFLCKPLDYTYIEEQSAELTALVVIPADLQNREFESTALWKCDFGQGTVSIHFHGFLKPYRKTEDVMERHFVRCFFDANEQFLPERCHLFRERLLTFPEISYPIALGLMDHFADESIARAALRHLRSMVGQTVDSKMFTMDEFSSLSRLMINNSYRPMRIRVSYEGNSCTTHDFTFDAVRKQVFEFGEIRRGKAMC